MSSKIAKKLPKKTLKEIVQMLMISNDYPIEILLKMRRAYMDSDYKRILNISANFKKKEN